MGNLVRFLFDLPGLRLITRPVTRMLLKLIAIPIFRFVLKYLLRVEVISEELEKDLSQWFRASLLLLIATHNMEELLFQTGSKQYKHETEIDALLFGLRLLLAIGCIEGMPDQELFRLIHPGPPKLKSRKIKDIWRELGQTWRSWLWGIFCIHLSRSSPVFVIVSVIHIGLAGWVCYGVAIFQYLIIGLVTSRDKALDVLSAFDAEVSARRQELLSGLDPSPPTAPPMPVPPMSQPTPPPPA